MLDVPLGLNYRISIPAPARGRTAAIAAKYGWDYISIPAPARGRTSRA